jgi:hypothetical protein
MKKSSAQELIHDLDALATDRDAPDLLDHSLQCQLLRIALRCMEDAIQVTLVGKQDEVTRTPSLPLKPGDALLLLSINDEATLSYLNQI